jgi:hypothetical protein
MQKQPYRVPELRNFQYNLVIGISLPIGTSLPENPLEAHESLEGVNQ